jgi:hypothetical protein
MKIEKSDYGFNKKYSPKEYAITKLDYIAKVTKPYTHVVEEEKFHEAVVNEDGHIITAPTHTPAVTEIREREEYALCIDIKKIIPPTPEQIEIKRKEHQKRKNEYDEKRGHQLKIAELKKQLEPINEDLMQDQAGLIVPDLPAKKERLRTIVNQIRALEGKPPKEHK